MVGTLVVLGLIALLAHGLGLAVATRVIARNIEDQFPPDGTMVEIDRGRLCVHERAPVAGESDALPVILIHGATSTCRDIALPLLEPLARTRRTIAVDRPGHGWSTRIGGRETLGPAAQADAIVALMDRLGIERAIVAGHSYSGAVAARMALDHPGRVAGLAILAGATFPWPGGIKWYYRLASWPVIGPLFVRTLVVPVAAASFGYQIESSFAPAPAPTGYATKSAAALVLRPAEFRWNAMEMAVLKRCVREQSRHYGAIRVPTAIVTCEDDPVVPATVHSIPLSRAIPHARLTLLHGLGHQIHYSATATIVSEIEALAAAAGESAAGEMAQRSA